MNKSCLIKSCYLFEIPLCSGSKWSRDKHRLFKHPSLPCCMALYSILSFDESKNTELTKRSRKSECSFASLIFVFNKHMKKVQCQCQSQKMDLERKLVRKGKSIHTICSPDKMYSHQLPKVSSAWEKLIYN